MDRFWGFCEVIPSFGSCHFEGVFNRVLTELRLDWNNIGARGTIAIAEALKVNAILTKLWLGGNFPITGEMQGGKRCETR